MQRGWVGVDERYVGAGALPLGVLVLQLLSYNKADVRMEPQQGLAILFEAHATADRE